MPTVVPMMMFLFFLDREWLFVVVTPSDDAPSLAACAEVREDLLEDAEKTAPNDASIQYHLGMTCRKLSDETNAVAHLKKAASLAPNTDIGKDAQKALDQRA